MAQEWTHGGLNRFFLPNPIFLQFVWIFSSKIHSKNKYLPHFSSENCEINFIKSESPRAFQQHQEHPQIPRQFSVLILFHFHWENGSIINSFHTISPKSLKPSQCTPTHGELSKSTKSVPWSCGLGDLSMTKQNKANYLASAILEFCTVLQEHPVCHFFVTVFSLYMIWLYFFALKSWQWTLSHIKSVSKKWDKFHNQCARTLLVGMSSRFQGWTCKYNMQVLQVVHIQYMSTFVLQLRMLLDIFHSITNTSLLIACLLTVNYWSHARDVDCGKVLFSITMPTLECLAPFVLSTNLLLRLWEILK